MAFRIYPSIGIARLGNDLTQFFVGPEMFPVSGIDHLTFAIGLGSPST